MKFAVVAAIVAVAYAQDEAAAEGDAAAEEGEAAPVSACAEECVGEGECCALDADGAASCAVVAEGDGLACEELAAAGEGEGSTALFASVAAAFTAGAMMF